MLSQRKVLSLLAWEFLLVASQPISFEHPLVAACAAYCIAISCKAGLGTFMLVKQALRCPIFGVRFSFDINRFVSSKLFLFEWDDSKGQLKPLEGTRS